MLLAENARQLQVSIRSAFVFIVFILLFSKPEYEFGQQDYR